MTCKTCGAERFAGGEASVHTTADYAMIGSSVASIFHLLLQPRILRYLRRYPSAPQHLIWLWPQTNMTTISRAQQAEMLGAQLDAMKEKYVEEVTELLSVAAALDK